MGRGDVERDRATIRQVAERSGVSRATVSRAFTRPEMLSQATVDHVLSIARQMNYVPNQVARALSTGRYGNIALIVPDVANPFCPPIIRAAQMRADVDGYCVFLGNSDEDPARENTLIAKFAGQVEGLVLVSPRLPESQIRAHAARLPLVLINRDVTDIPRVLIDTASGVKQAVAHLFELGHRRIVYLSGPAASWSNRQRRNAVRSEAKRLGAEVIAISAVRPTFEAGLNATAKVLATRATAAIAFDDLTAQGLLVGLAQHGIDIPRRFSVVGCDDVLGAITIPPLTTVSSRCREAGEIAVGLITDTLRVRAMRDIRDVLDTHLVVRASTARAARAAEPD